MQLLKYRISNELHKRRLDTIITGTTINFVWPSIFVTFATSTKHYLVPDEELEISSGEITKFVKYTIVDDYTFKCSINVVENIKISSIGEIGNDRAAINLSQDVIGQVSDGRSFNLYDSNGTQLYSDCYFAYNRDNTYNTALIITQEDYFDNAIVGNNKHEIYLIQNSFIDIEGAIDGNYSFSPTIYEEETYCDLSLPLAKEYANDLYQDEIIQDSIDNEVNENLIPDIIDMEKQIFEPYILDSTTKMRASSIIFKLHFRNRYSGESLTEDWSIVNSTDRANWNDDANTDYSDSLLHLGFTDDDVKYRKNRLKKSFLRLSFYDTNDITNQNLLAYSTIFFDTTEMYSKYNKNVINDSSFTLENQSGDRIDSTITITDRYNKLKSSEGYYLYIYPSEIMKNDPETIYMKVEFNNAKYGKKTTLTIPRNDNGEAIDFKSVLFPFDYETRDSSNNVTGVDMASFVKDLFIPIKVKFDSDLNKYIYYFPWVKANDDRTITLTLFEPRAN